MGNTKFNVRYEVVKSLLKAFVCTNKANGGVVDNKLRTCQDCCYVGRDHQSSTCTQAWPSGYNWRELVLCFHLVADIGAKLEL